MRIGHGYDVHRFGEGDHITLGGVRIPHRFGLLAHSTVTLLYALSDALPRRGAGRYRQAFPGY